MPVSQRRSRMHRKRTGKRVEITRRDLAIFQLLTRYRYLNSNYIHAFVGGVSETRFKERLGDLFHEGYLDRPGRQWGMANCRHRPAIHELDAGAERVLHEHGVVEAPRTCLGASPHRQFSHSVVICETIASIELGTHLRASTRFIPWPEILAKAPAGTRASAAPFRLPATISSTVVPDGLFGIEYNLDGKKAYRFFALEVDRGTMPVARSNPNQTSYLAKIAAYRDLISRQVHKTHLGLPNLLVLTVTTNDQHKKEIMHHFKGPTDQSAAFLFKAVEQHPKPERSLLTEPWERVGHAPLAICAP
jgi:hypothetical protein